MARLGEGRVRRVLEPMMAGGHVSSGTYDEDAAYVRDLGLIKTRPELEVANPIYREVIARVLAAKIEGDIRVTSAPFVSAAGTLDIEAVLRSFASFWRQHGEVLTGALRYHEVAPQLVLMAYLQSIVNGHGFIDREYGVGRGAIDLCLRWPYPGPDGDRAWQRAAFELKLWRDKQPDPLESGLTQLDAYLAGLGLDAGVLVIFDRRTDRPGTRATGGEGAGRVPAEVALASAETPSGRAVTLLRA